MSSSRINSADHLEIDGCDTVELADRFGTPLWVLSESRIRDNLCRLRDAFCRVYPRTRVIYASKANPEPAILRIVKLEGALVDVVTLGHIRLALSAGYHPKEIVFNGNSKTLAELRWALEHGIGIINVDSLEEMEAIARLQSADAQPIKVCLRLATDSSRHLDDPEFARSDMESKFGMTEVDAEAAATIATQHPTIRIVGVHNHIGFTAYGITYSSELDLRRRRRAAEQTVSFGALLAEKYGIQIKYVNLGGGFRANNSRPFGPGGLTDFPTAHQYGQEVGGHVADLVRRSGLGEPELLLEAGGYVVSDAVTLLARVGFRKPAPHSSAHAWVFVEETSAYHFARRLMFDFHHDVVTANKMTAEPSEEVIIAGATCASDSLTSRVKLPPLDREDLIAVLDQGSYCESISSDYCAIPAPAAVLAYNAKAEIVRHRETADDLLGRFSVPTRLADEGETPLHVGLHQETTEESA